MALRGVQLAFALSLGTAALADPAAEAIAVLGGRWGTDAQCKGALILPGGTWRAAPFEIGAGWLSQGPVWCQLQWFDAQAQTGGFHIAARALCGEDAAQGYTLGIQYRGGAQERLTLIWSEALINGPLRRCGPAGADRD